MDTNPLSDALEKVSDAVAVSGSDQKRLSPILDKLVFYLLGATIVLTPLVFAPILADSFDLPRQALLFLLVFLASTIFLLQILIGARKASLTRSFIDAPLVLLPLAIFVSAILSPNKFASLSGDLIIYASCTVLFLLLIQNIASQEKAKTITILLLFSSAILSVWSIVQNVVTLLGSKIVIPQTFLPFLNPAFSPTGSTLSQAIFLAILLPLGIGLTSEVIKKKEPKTLPAVLTILAAIGLILNILTLFSNRPITLPFDSGWKIATGTIGQSLKSAFFGAGPNNYIDSFTAFKAADFNNLPIWNLRFVTSSNLFFYLLTTVGIIGLAILLWLAIKIIQVCHKRLDASVTGPMEKGQIAALLVSLFVFLILPTPQVGFFAAITALALFVSSLRFSGNTKLAWEDDKLLDQASWLRPAIFLLCLVILLTGSYFLARLVLADWHFANSLQAAAANQGTQTYNEQIAALTLNPWNENYRVSYSQTNLALANALASQPNLSDQQKQTVLTLVQQSIREGRNAVALSPNRTNDWENLSLIYRNLINFAQGADQFAIATQNQAISFDPTNPRLRLELGGIYFSLKDFQSAGQAFAQATSLKPDYANAHYNLAQALKELKLTDQALQQLQLTSTLVCTTKQSPDCQKVTAEITALGEKPASPSAEAPLENPLSTPSAKSNLPKAATKPPATIASPSGEITP